MKGRCIQQGPCMKFIVASERHLEEAVESEAF